MHTLPAPARMPSSGLPKTAGIRGDRDAPAAGPQSTPFCETYHGENGGSIRGNTSLSSDGSQPESCSGCLDPRDGAQAPSPRNASLREQESKPAALVISLIQTDLNRSLECADVSAKRIQKNSKPGSQKAASECPSCIILHDAKAAEPDNSRNPILQTGSRLRRGPYII